MNQNAQDYDRLIYRAAPNYETSLVMVADLVPGVNRIVSLGTGTGNLEKKVLDKKNCKIIGFDTNEEYLRLARQKGIEGIEGDITQINYPKTECIISALTLHHVEEKDKVFKKIYNALSPNGLFLNYDIVKARTSKEHEEFVRYVTQFMRSNNLSEDFIAEEIDIMNGIGKDADKPTTLEKQKELLEKLGFDFQIKGQDQLFVIYSARKIN